MPTKNMATLINKSAKSIALEKKIKQKVAVVAFTEKELDLLIWLIDDWQNIMSDQQIGIVYPNDSISSTQLIQFLNNIRNEMVEAID